MLEGSHKNKKPDANASGFDSLLSSVACCLLSVASQANLAALVTAWQTQECRVVAMWVMASCALNERLWSWAAAIGTGVQWEVGQLEASCTCVHVPLGCCTGWASAALCCCVNNTGCSSCYASVGADGSCVVSCSQTKSACACANLCEVWVFSNCVWCSCADTATSVLHADWVVVTQIGTQIDDVAGCGAVVTCVQCAHHVGLRPATHTSQCTCTNCVGAVAAWGVDNGVHSLCTVVAGQASDRNGTYWSFFSVKCDTAHAAETGVYGSAGYCAVPDRSCDLLITTVGCVAENTDFGCAIGMVAADWVGCAQIVLGVGNAGQCDAAYCHQCQTTG